MEENKRAKIRLLLCILLAGVLAAAVLCWIWRERADKERWNGSSAGEKSAFSGDCLSLDSGFYTESQGITIQVPQGSRVYYTDNGELPDAEHGYLYEEPIWLDASEENVLVFRFRAFYEDGTESEIITRTYFMGEEIGQRYSTPVLHITGEPEDLFGYENGIFTTGRIFDEFLEKNPDVHFGSGVDANFTQRGREWEREVYIQYFDEYGTEIIAQNGGIRINGGASRMKKQKSFRLYARKEYDEKNEFRYPFLDNFISAADGTVAQKYKRLNLRNSGNDNGFAYIRSELTCALAADAGFLDVMHAVPVCVYMNGDYKGIYWLENGYDAGYFEARYGEYEGEFVVLEGSDQQKSASEDETQQSYVEGFNEQYQSFCNLDLTIEENYQKLEQFIDVENYLKYVAIENYVGNMDWPGNNLKVYRYVSPDGSYKENTVFDGRYRYLLYDLDYAFGLLVLNGTVGFAVQAPTLGRLWEGAPLFAALMEREDCRQYFINYTCDLGNGAMSPSHVAEVLDDMDLQRREELSHMMEDVELMEEDIWTWEDDACSRTYEDVAACCKQINYFAEERQKYVIGDIIENLGGSYEDVYTLQLQCKDIFSMVQINSIVSDEETFAGVYFANVPVSLKPHMAQNEIFDHWVVNGDIRKEEELVLTAEDVKEQEIHVELVVQEVEEPLLQISAVKAKGHNDFIELINRSRKPIYTAGYFLSDNEDAYKYALPAMTIQPGESRRFYGKDCLDGEGLGQIGLNFNLKRDEVITLTYGTQTIETLVVPNLSDGGIYQRDTDMGKFTEVLEEQL